MGIYDRDYFREGRRSNRRARLASWPIYVYLILINIALFLVNAFCFPDSNLLTNFLCMTGDVPSHPLDWYRFITYSFVHSSQDLMHIIGNMFVLWFFGRAIESRYGKKEFLFFYLTAALLGGLVWGLFHWGTGAKMLGASGAVTATLILYILLYPRQTLLFNFFIPIPAWILGIINVASDLRGAYSGIGNTAYEVHLAGTVFALLYFWGSLRLTPIFSAFWPSQWIQRLRERQADRRAKRELKIRRDKLEKMFEFTQAGQKTDPFDEEVDRILRKIQAQGRTSLSEKEEETLRQASELKKKGRDNNDSR